MHNSDLDTSVSSLNLALDLSVGHLRENFSDSLDSLSKRHRIPLSYSLENVGLVLWSILVVDVPHGELNSREPVSNSIDTLSHPVLLLSLLSSSPSLRSRNLRLWILSKWKSENDSPRLLGPSLTFPLLISLPLLSSAPP